MDMGISTGTNMTIHDVDSARAVLPFVFSTRDPVREDGVIYCLDGFVACRRKRKCAFLIVKPN